MPARKPAAKTAGERAAKQELQFVISTNVDKADPELRKFIRSHVMLGKNVGKTRSSGSKTQRDATAVAAVAASKAVLETKVNQLSNEGSLSRDKSSGGPDLVRATFQPLLPPKLDRTYWSLAAGNRWAGGVGSEVVDVVLRFSTVAKVVLFPLEPCMFFERRAESWVAPLAFDTAYLHSMIFTAQYFFDAIVPRKLLSYPQRVLPHYLETLRLLRVRFEHGTDQVRIADTTIAAVMGLAGHAHMVGDRESARHHLDGLQRIVKMRGGIATFKANAKLLVEILRSDLGASLHTGAKPVFFSDRASKEAIPLFPNLRLLLEPQRPSAAAGHSAEHEKPFPDMDDELIHLWDLLADFCSVVNFAVDSSQRISTETFLETMSSAMYRLLELRFEADSRGEALRLGLLALSCSIFLHWKYLGMPYDHLARCLRQCLTSMTGGFSRLPPQTRLWLVFISAVSVFGDEDGVWLRPLLLADLRTSGVESWSGMQQMVRSFMWVGLVHDKPGQRFYDSAIEWSNSPSGGGSWSAALTERLE